MEQLNLDEKTYIYFPFPDVGENNLIKFSQNNVYMEFDTFMKMLNHIISNYIVYLDGAKFQMFKSQLLCEINSDFEGFKISAYRYDINKPTYVNVYKYHASYDIKIKDIGLDESMLQIANDNYCKYVIMCKFNELKELTQTFLNTQTTFDNTDKYQKIIKIEKIMI